jgi:hypothetical protein
VEEEVLGLAFAGDKTEAPIREGLNCSSHVCFCFVLLLEIRLRL